MGEGITTRIQKELTALQSATENITLEMRSNHEKLRLESQQYTDGKFLEARAYADACHFEVTAKLNQILPLLIGKQFGANRVESVSGKNFDAVHEQTDFSRSAVEDIIHDPDQGSARRSADFDNESPDSVDRSDTIGSNRNTAATLEEYREVSPVAVLDFNGDRSSTREINDANAFGPDRTTAAVIEAHIIESEFVQQQQFQKVLCYVCWKYETHIHALKLFVKMPLRTVKMKFVAMNLDVRWLLLTDEIRRLFDSVRLFSFVNSVARMDDQPIEFVEQSGSESNQHSCRLLFDRGREQERAYEVDDNRDMCVFTRLFVLVGVIDDGRVYVWDNFDSYLLCLVDLTAAEDCKWMTIASSLLPYFFNTGDRDAAAMAEIVRAISDDFVVEGSFPHGKVPSTIHGLGTAQSFHSTVSSREQCTVEFDMEEHVCILQNIMIPDSAPRSQADQILRDMQNNSDMWLQVVHILQQTKSLNTKFFALQVLEGVIKYRWNTLSTYLLWMIQRSLRENKSNPMDSEQLREYGHKMVDFIADYYKTIEDFPVLSQVEPGYLRNLLPDSAPNQPDSFQHVLDVIQAKIFPGVTHWQSPNFFAYYPSNSSVAGLVGEMLTAGLNIVGFSWITSPAATELEMIVLDWLAKMLKLPEDFLSAGQGGGVIQGTASEAVLVVLLAARDKVLRRVGKDELAKLVVYASDQTHSALQKACQIAGIHTENCRMLKTDSSTNYALSPELLSETISHDLTIGLFPFFLCATVGTTSSTAVDPLLALGKIAKSNGMWFHIDARQTNDQEEYPTFDA